MQRRFDRREARPLMARPRPRGLTATLLLLRLCNALAVQTYFNPDEYWQGPEVAHRIAFGYGHRVCTVWWSRRMGVVAHRPWEWSSEHGIRSVSHPALYAAVFTLLRYTVRCTVSLTRHTGY